ncbi:hypothetical protein NC651_028090 [Populus alba x Populus x berolinensis]|nr:hypothetical protein NC651_028090 [Populus alba x Populus x berolinensis]
MAKDAIALMDHLGWRKAHIFGHSMGESVIPSFPFLLLPLLNATEINCSQQLIPSLVHVTVETGAMIACKLAAMVPDRVLSLALLNVTGGGFECLPKLDSRTISVAIRFLKAKTPEQRAAVDLDTHYTKVNDEEQTRNLSSSAEILSRSLLLRWKMERKASLKRSNGMCKDKLGMNILMSVLGLAQEEQFCISKKLLGFASLECLIFL